MTRLGIIAAAFLLLAALARFPAAWVAPRLAQLTHDRWRLADVEGTLWNGRAALYASEGSSGRWLPGRVLNWRVRWRALLKGRLAVTLELGTAGTAELIAGIPGWSLERFDTSVPAADMATLLPSALSEYGWSGMLNAHGGSFSCSWTRVSCTGQIVLSWKAAGTRQIPGPPLGDYRLRLTGEGQALRFDLGTERGRLQIAGSGELSSSQVRFTGDAFATGADSSRLDAVLRMVGRPGPEPGHYRIEYRELQGNG